MATLIRDGDNAGFSGSRVESYKLVKARSTGGKEVLTCVGNEPMVGCSLLVGSVTAGTYSDRDWWCTTPITKILGDDGETIRFKTGNSVYTFKR